jgi:hypothetical protein
VISREVDEPIDTNVLNAESSALNISGTPHVGIYVCGETGTHTTAVATIQVQPVSGAGWVDTIYKITGAGCLPYLGIVAWAVRIKVTKVEGVASISRVIMLPSED